MEFEIGQIIGKENYTQAAVWCNKNGAHIEKQGEDYVIVANPDPAEPTVEEQVRSKEAETGLTRAVREVILGNDLTVSEYVKAQAQEIEALAVELRN